MRLDERWIWVGEPLSAEEAGLRVFREYPGRFWLVRGPESAGPFGDATILRALRAACAQVIDGCEKGPGKSGFTELEGRRPLEAHPRQHEVLEPDLPPSVTHYDAKGLEPAVGCCSRFDAPPPVTWKVVEGWETFRETVPAHAGTLARPWNAHPEGSLVFCDDGATMAGLTIVDLAGRRA